ncbi:hypothetical protein [Paenibacillus ginsengarvi]|uniref:hypothetical protein n=1 Tax=Paenibacillus ginsengarvi TaxID=400777 RepID=UPI0019602CDC|nr:hypothetical protein [Paenibacillus ginsengarvi]
MDIMAFSYLNDGLNTTEAHTLILNSDLFKEWISIGRSFDVSQLENKIDALVKEVEDLKLSSRYLESVAKPRQRFCGIGASAWHCNDRNGFFRYHDHSHVAQKKRKVGMVYSKPAKLLHIVELMSPVGVQRR